MKKKIVAIAALTGASLILGHSGSAFAGGGKTDMLQQLKALVERQQSQLDKQAAEISKLNEELRTLSGKTNAKADKVEVEKGYVTKDEMKKQKLDKMVNSSLDKVDVKLYGQVDRGFLYADDGKDSKGYFVDNKNSTTRMGIDAKAKVTDDFSVGSKIEYEIVTDSSNDVNPDHSVNATSTNFSKRHLDAFLISNSMGKLSLGHGSTASDGTSEVDLSGTSVVAYSSVSDLAGGQLFTDVMLSDARSTTSIKGTFNNMDGLSRQDRIRYDSPSFAGFSLGGSAIQGDAYDLALKYSQKFSALTVAAALAYATPGDLNTKADKAYNGSLSILHGSGLNFTAATGTTTWDDGTRDDANYWYGKLGYQAKLNNWGPTCFSIDYGKFDDWSKNEDEGDSYGIALVQQLKDYGTELFVAYRLYSMDRVKTDYNDISAIMAGTRIKF